MTADELKASSPDQKNLPGPLRALILIHRGEFDAAHKLVQDDESPAAAWVHAHIHRIEGDLSNADYWYSVAGKRSSRAPLEKEWCEIAHELGRVLS